MIQKNKITDIFAGKPKIFEKIKHDPNSLICEHCKYNEREDWLADFIKTFDINQKNKLKNESTGVIIDQSFDSVVVHRGRFNDVIGVSVQWL